MMSPMSNRGIKEDLKILGLDSTEVEVYNYLLQYEYQSLLEISRALNIPRATIYKAGDRLVKKMFAEWVLGETGVRLKAVRPDKLSFIIRKKEKELENIKESLEKVKLNANEILYLVPKTQVRYYQGREGLRQMLWNCLKAKGEIFGYSEFGRIEVVGREFYNQYVKEFKLRGIRDRVITTENSIEYIKKHVISHNERHQLSKWDIRILKSDDYYISGDSSIYNNVYAISYWKKGEIVGVEIENPEFVKMHKSIFEIVWNNSIPLHKYIKKIGLKI